MSERAIKIISMMFKSFWPLLKSGIAVTVPMAIISFTLGLVLAFIIAMMRISSIKPLVWIAKFYVWAVRGIPLIVLLFIIFYGLPGIGVIFNPFVSGVIGLTMSQGAYNSEIIRSAITSVNKGQWEATKALGMNTAQSLRHIIVPQAALVAMPPLGNQFTSLVKDTSLTATLTVLELFQKGQMLVAVYFEPLWLYIEVGIIYLIFNSVLSVGQNVLEKHLGKHLLALQTQVRK